MAISEQPKQLEEFWKTVYRSRENKTAEVWNTERRNQYEYECEVTQTRMNEYLRVRGGRNHWTEWEINPNLKEHLDIALQCEEIGAQPMKVIDVYMTKEKVKNS